jgi:uncharacterized membrane protein
VTNWVPLALGALLVGVLIGRSVLKLGGRGATSGGQRVRRVRDYQAWVLLGLGLLMGVAALIGTRSWFLDVVIAAFYALVGITILINNRRSIVDADGDAKSPAEDGGR